jgi:enamine deaminase RidA (YjgF/YER057c/UK114 family)
MDRRAWIDAGVAGMMAGCWAVSGSFAGPAQAAGTQQPQADGPGHLVGLYPEGAPAADVGYSPGISAGGQRVIFVSGQGPADYDADIETQIRQTFQRIGAVLKVGGASFRDVAMMRSYFVNIRRDLASFRKVRREFLIKPYPASTAVGVSALADPKLQVEIEAIALVAR